MYCMCNELIIKCELITIFCDFAALKTLADLSSRCTTCFLLYFPIRVLRKRFFSSNLTGLITSQALASISWVFSPSYSCSWSGLGGAFNFSPPSLHTSSVTTYAVWLSQFRVAVLSFFTYPLSFIHPNLDAQTRYFQCCCFIVFFSFSNH